MCDLFGGPSAQEKALQGQSENMASTLQANAQEEFGEQQDTISHINSQINRIESGQTGPGFSASEEAARVGQIQNNAGATARNVSQAVQNQNAGQTFQGEGDSSGLGRTSAIRQQIDAEAKSTAANQEASQLNQNTAENFATGRNNAATTLGGLNALAGIESPNAAYSEATQANNTSFGQAKTIEQQNQQRAAAIASLIAAPLKLGGSFLTGGLSNLGPGSGVGDFFKGGLNGLTGNDTNG